MFDRLAFEELHGAFFAPVGVARGFAVFKTLDLEDLLAAEVRKFLLGLLRDARREVGVMSTQVLADFGLGVCMVPPAVPPAGTSTSSSTRRVGSTTSAGSGRCRVHDEVSIPINTCTTAGASLSDATSTDGAGTRSTYGASRSAS